MSAASDVKSYDSPALTFNANQNNKVLSDRKPLLNEVVGKEFVSDFDKKSNSAKSGNQSLLDFNLKETDNGNKA